MIRRSVFEKIGGFDSSLRAADAQGCEDLMICLKAAEVTEFAVVPQHLVGYRISHQNMSSDVAQMRRSLEFVLAGYRNRYPQYKELCAANLSGNTSWLIARALQARRLQSARELYRVLRKSDPQFARSNLPDYIKIYAKSLIIPRRFKAAIRRIISKPFPNHTR